MWRGVIHQCQAHRSCWECKDRRDALLNINVQQTLILCNVWAEADESKALPVGHAAIVRLMNDRRAVMPDWLTISKFPQQEEESLFLNPLH